MKKSTYLKKLELLLNKNTKLIAVLICVAVFILFSIFGVYSTTTKDEALYMREAMTISEVLISGKWIGNYGVGLHGFLFKIPAALLFWITGPSPFMAVLTTVVLASLSCWILFKICYDHLKLSTWSLAVTLLFIVNYQFVLATPTFLREIPVVFATLLFLYSVISKKNPWISGLALMLVLDAKEYVFFAFLPAILLYLFVVNLEDIRSCFNVSNINNCGKSIIKVSYSALAILGPSLIFLFLMFFTGLIPINMFNAAILGVVKRTGNWNLVQFIPKQATENQLGYNPKQILGAFTEGSFWNNLGFLSTFISMSMLYVKKILNPGTFSLLATPLFIVIPAVFISLKKSFAWFREKRTSLLILTFTTSLYLLIYLFRISHGRYLFPITPGLIIMFIMFIKDRFTKRSYISLLSAIIVLTLASLSLEEKNLEIKTFIYIVVLIAFGHHFYTQQIKKAYSSAVTLFLITLFSTAAASFGSFYSGRILVFKSGGNYNEFKKISTSLPLDKRVWFNDIGWSHLPFFYRKDVALDPQWHWKLEDFVPKKHLLIYPQDGNTYNFVWESDEELASLVSSNSIDYLTLILSANSDVSYSEHIKFHQLFNAQYTKLENIEKVGDKILFVFRVKN